ncbi:MAG: hypothetical protein EXR21_10410 [Flavobacteriaceae bacterium]|nr:hypothetical protein [Flavobacteriaceae bacterium]
MAIRKVGSKTVIVTASTEFTSFIALSVNNTGAGTATVTGSAENSQAVNLGAGQSLSLSEDRLGLSYDGITVDGSSSTCHVIFTFYVNE